MYMVNMVVKRGTDVPVKQMFKWNSEKVKLDDAAANVSVDSR